jgi:hypothetical protein
MARPCARFSPARVNKVCLSAQRSADRSVQPRSHGHCAAGLPPPCAGLPGDVLAPHRLGNALEQTLRLAAPHRPPRGTAVSTGAAALCPCRYFLSPRNPLSGALRIAYRSWRSAAVPLLPRVLYGLSSFLASVWNVLPQDSCVKTRPSGVRFLQYLVQCCGLRWSWHYCFSRDTRDSVRRRL